MKKSTCYYIPRYYRRYGAACLLGLTSLPHFGMAQVASRAIPPTNPPMTLLCSPAYGQQPGATYVAANHLSGSFTTSDIGVSGTTTTIDASLYGGTVIFRGIYKVRGHIKLVNGTFELRPGTVFYVEGLSGQFVPNTAIPVLTTIEVENGHLELAGAGILSTCPRAWGGISLLAYGRITTRTDPAATAPAGRSFIRDAYVGVNVMGQASQRSTGEYYLNGTDFVNNHVGVYDAGKMVARAGEGIHYCSFSTDAALKAPIADINAYPPIGVSLASSDQPLGFNNYAAASIDHSSFQHLNIGINGTGQQLRIVDNTFDYCWRAAIDLDFTPNG